MIKVASFNIGEDESHDNNIVNMESYEYIKQMIIENEIDIICLQENITSSDSIVPVSKYISENTALKYNCDFELSRSYINTDCMMGVSICSKFNIDFSHKFMFKNPGLAYKKNDTTTFLTPDKGFIVAYINEIPLVLTSGHCLSFRKFKKNPTDYIEIFKEMENKFIDIINNNPNVIIAGDMNYANVGELFPNVLNLTNRTSFGNTYKDVQIDHVLISKNIKCLNSEMVKTRFDHNLCIITIDL